MIGKDLVRDAESHPVSLGGSIPFITLFNFYYQSGVLEYDFYYKDNKNKPWRVDQQVAYVWPTHQRFAILVDYYSGIVEIRTKQGIMFLHQVRRYLQSSLSVGL